jgi:hypothetical protein
MLDTPEFNSPGDMLKDIEKARSDARAVVNPSELLGTWNACDPDTSGLVRVVVAGAGAGTTVQVFGACHPTPCDWGVEPAIAYAANVSSSDSVAFTATYKVSFKKVIVTGVLDSGSLRVETFNKFTDGSGRSDYYSKGYLCRRKRQ